MINESDNKSVIRSILLIFLGFFLTSTAWLSWEYHLLELLPPAATDISTMVAGYLLQALGIGIFALVNKRSPELARPVSYFAVIVHFVCLAPSVLSPHAAGALVFGFLMNICCGIIAACYLHLLALEVDKSRKAVAFGIGYALAILTTWLLSLADSIYYSPKILGICAAVSGAIIILINPKFSMGDDTSGGSTGVAAEAEGSVKSGRAILPASLLVLLFSIVNSSGFAFPSADIGVRADLELSRLAYAAGLVIAGVVTGRSRKYGALLALTALMMPFIIMALRGESISAYAFWLLSYFTFGFYAVYRIIIFSDIASDTGLLYMSGFGLMIGRIGDAVGEALCIAFVNHITLLVIISAVLFAAVVFVFFKEYAYFYVPESGKELSEQEKIRRFAAQHDLSVREKDVFRLLLEDHSNSEISDILFISENTVKYHIKNLLSKTGCRNRKELTASYISYFDQ